MRWTLLRYRLALLLFVGCLPACSPTPHGEADVTAALESFYGAIKSGNASAAMAVVAQDAIFLESGGLETRAEYEANHLPADIGFEREVTGKRSPWQVTLEGETAWVIATTDYVGTFENTPVDFVSAQLAVLTYQDGNWLIRAIHWSSQPR